MNRAMAFWKYDTYPYVLAAEIKEFKHDGLVSVEGFTSYLFRPILILEYEEGLVLKNQLETLKKEYRQEKENLHKNYLDKKEELFKKI